MCVCKGGGSGGAMVLGKLPGPGRPAIWISVGQGPIALAVGAGGGCLDIFTLIYPFSPLSPSLWETARYRLTYCLKGPLNPKPTNQPFLCHPSVLATCNMLCFTIVLLSVGHGKNMKTTLFSFLLHDMMTFIQRYDDVIYR